MSQRFVYLVDSDSNLTAHLTGALARYGFRVEGSADANELMARKDDLPQLVVLCIDPKRTGWAVCNRLRKAMQLKDTPLIITSAEATEKDFEDHKKLKTRAEEYLHKPFAVEALVEKIGALVGMPPGAGAYEMEIPMEAEEVAIEDDSSIIEEDAEAEPLYGTPDAPTHAGFVSEEGEHTRVGVMNMVDGELDAETDAAFAAIGAEDGTEAHGLPAVPPVSEPTPTLQSAPLPKAAPFKRTATPPPPRPSAAELPLDEHYGGDDDPFALPQHDAGAMPSPLPPADSQPLVTMRDAPSEPIDLGLDDVARQAAAEPSRPRAASQPRIITSAARSEGSVAAPLLPLTPVPPMPVAADNTAAHDTGAAALGELKREREQLKREVEELQKKLAARPETPPAPVSSGFSREREFLNLREIINKKEKEVLDLRDSNDAKERLLLDGKDKIRELDRKARESDEHGLGIEKELVAAKEKIEALGHDKERVVEREKQVKARLDDALKSIGKYEQELEGLRQKQAAEAAATQQQQAEALAAHEREQQALKAQHQTLLEAQAAEHGQQLQRTSDAHEEDKALLVSQHEEERARMENELADQLQRLRDSADNERNSLKVRLEQQLADAESTREQQVGTLVSEHANALQKLKLEQSQALQEKEQLHSDEIAGLRARNTKDSKEAERRHQEEVAQAAERHRAELQAAEQRRAAELNQKADEHRAEIQALAADQTAERQRQEADHGAAVLALDERRQTELREAAELHAGELEKTKKQLEQKLADELKAARDQHMRKMTALEESHADLKTGMLQRHAQLTEDLKKEHGAVLAALQTQLADRERLIGEANTRIGDLEQLNQSHEAEGKRLQGRIGELEGLLKSTREDVNARELTLNERARRIEELEKESAGYQDQILKAYQRIKSDESIVSRAKKALAIALTLLDESAPDGGDEASS